MLTNSGRDMPREQNDDCAVVFPAADAEPVTPGATAPTSAGLLAIGKPQNYNTIAQKDEYIYIYTHTHPFNAQPTASKH